MKDLKDEWDKLFILRLMALKIMNEKEIQLSATGVVTMGIKTLVFGSNTIINDILLWCNMKDLTLLYFRCVCEMFQKYRVSFCLDKCEFLKPCVEYVGHDIH